MGDADDGSSVALAGGSVENGTPPGMETSVGTKEGTAEGEVLEDVGVVGLLVMT